MRRLGRPGAGRQLHAGREGHRLDSLTGGVDEEAAEADARRTGGIRIRKSDQEIAGNRRRTEAVKLAFEFMVLTAARPGEVRGAVWPEIDTAGRVWTIPALRMKATREHRVPLCRRALEVLDAARALGDGGNPVVFPSGNGKPLDEKRMHRALQWGRITAVPHGFRSSFRDWAAEETDHPREVVEAALAHVVQNKVEAAYARSDLFERRRRLMNDWEVYLSVPAMAVSACATPRANPVDHA